MDIVFEDSALYIIVKPSGLLSVPGRKPENQDSVLSRLQSLGEAHCAHRLDMATSGLMVVAKNKAVLRDLNQQFAERKVFKRYQAVVDGLLDISVTSIEAPIRCDWPNRPRQMICPNGKPSTTRVKLLAHQLSSETSLLELEPVTGRSHQLRIHLEYIGHPILGCEFYAPANVRAKANQLCLHACELGIKNPITGENQIFQSSPDFKLNAVA